jgi:hypothetical protein
MTARVLLLLAVVATMRVHATFNLDCEVFTKAKNHRVHTLFEMHLNFKNFTIVKMQSKLFHFFKAQKFILKSIFCSEITKLTQIISRSWAF